MHRIRMRRITLAVLCVVPMAATAEEGIRLKPQRSLLSLPPAKDEAAPIFMEADRLQGHAEKETEAQGNVHVRRLGQTFSADSVRYEAPTQQLDAKGNVRLEQRGDTRAVLGVIDVTEATRRVVSRDRACDVPHGGIRPGRLRTHETRRRGMMPVDERPGGTRRTVQCGGLGRGIRRPSRRRIGRLSHGTAPGTRCAP